MSNEEREKNCLTCRKMTGCDNAESVTENLSLQEQNEVLYKHVCEEWKSRYIEYPITVTEIELSDRVYRQTYKTGKFVAIRPCFKEYGDKTYLGLMLGELPGYTHVSYSEDTGILKIRPALNPAMFVFELNRVVYGRESWWRVIEKEEDLKQIGDTDIDNVWYVRALKSLAGKETTDGQEKSDEREPG